MIAQELKKIFDKKRVLLIVILAVLFYILIFRQNIGIPVYSSERIHLDVSLTMIEKYGNELDETEYRDLLNNFVYAKTSNAENSNTGESNTEENDIKESNIDIWIKGNNDFRQYGIESYRDLLTVQDSLSDDAASSLTSQIYTRFTEEERKAALDQIWKEGYIEILVEAYDADAKSNQNAVYYPEIPKKADKRIKERNQEEIYSLMPDNVMRNYLAILPDFAIFLFLSMILLTVPYSVKDTMEVINVLQYVSQKGCRYYWKKAAAVFISSVILCAVETGLFALMLSKNDTFCFVYCFVSGFRNPFITFMKLTFGQYIIMSMVYTAAIALCLSMITYGLSSCAHNYISAIAFQIPVIIFSIAVSLMLMPRFAEITQSILLLFLIPLICLFAAIIGNVVRFLSIKYYEQV